MNRKVLFITATLIAIVAGASAIDALSINQNSPPPQPSPTPSSDCNFTVC